MLNGSPHPLASGSRVSQAPTGTEAPKLNMKASGSEFGHDAPLCDELTKRSKPGGEVCGPK